MTTLEQLIANTNYDHSRYVAKISRIIAMKAGYSIAEAEIIEQAGLLHDVGKSSISPHILNKPGILTAVEYETVKKHTESGYQQIMDVIKTLTIAASVVKEHHERLDGSGYMSLSNGNISPYSRLIAVADVFDALISKRVYKESWNINSVIQYLTAHDNYFDHIIVICLVSVINELISLYKTYSDSVSPPQQNGLYEYRNCL